MKHTHVIYHINLLMSVIYQNSVHFRKLFNLNNCFNGLKRQEVDFLFVAKSKALSFQKN